MDAPREVEELPWARLDPVALQKEAEAKEAKLKRQQERRDVRADARREKRHQKSEAKQARKANVKRAAKWNPERKAADRLKKLANRPLKQEKRRKRMLKRAEKLEEQSKKLWAEAQKARARHEYLNKLKAEEDREKNRLLDEVEEMAAAETNDYIPLGDEDGLVDLARARHAENGDSEELAVTNGHAETSDEELADGDGDIDMFEDPGKIELELKAASVDVFTYLESEPVDEPDVKASKKSKKSRPDETEEERQARKERRKEKKRKLEAQAAPTNGVSADDASAKDSKKENKSKKDKKRRHEAEAEAAEEAVEERPKKKSKKDKKSKEKALEKYGNSSSAALEPKADVSEQWNVHGLEGGAARQDKFLRLLGGKKDGKVDSLSKSTRRERLDAAHVTDELEKQFDAGVRMKYEASGQKRGLGA